MKIRIYHLWNQIENCVKNELCFASWLVVYDTCTSAGSVVALINLIGWCNSWTNFFERGASFKGTKLWDSATKVWYAASRQECKKIKKSWKMNLKVFSTFPYLSPFSKKWQIFVTAIYPRSYETFELGNAFRKSSLVKLNSTLSLVIGVIYVWAYSSVRERPSQDIFTSRSSRSDWLLRPLNPERGLEQQCCHRMPFEKFLSQLIFSLPWKIFGWKKNPFCWDQKILKFWNFFLWNEVIF